MADEIDLTKVTVTATVGGQPFSVRIGTMTGEQIGQFRAATGVGLMQALADLDLDRFAALVWVVRARQDRKIQLKNVLAKVTYADLESIDIDDGSEPDDSEDEAGDALDPE
jgi:hypothetical protein